MKILFKLLFAVVLIATTVAFTSCNNDNDEQGFMSKVDVEQIQNVNIRVSGDGTPGFLPEAKGYVHVITRFKKGEDKGRAIAFDANGKKTTGKLSSKVINGEQVIAFNDLDGNTSFDFTTREKVRYNQYDCYVFSTAKVVEVVQK